MFRKSGLYFLICVALIVSCKNSGVQKGAKIASKESSKNERSVLLKIEDAALVQDAVDPDSNTAEWSFKVDQPGRYEVWLSSITRDTMHMGFDTVVTITAGDSRIEKMPLGDKIITNAKDIKAPWYRADSEMGTIFFNAPGEYAVQIISEKVKTLPADISSAITTDKTLIKSLILKPVVY
jgi:hypothetical protein